MSLDKVKIGISIFLLIFISEVIRVYTGIPVTILDVMLLPITGILIYIGFYTLLNRKKDKNKNVQAAQSIWQLLGGILFITALVPVGVWITWLGAEKPFLLFTGVKGSVHGYTLVYLGAIVAVISVVMGYVFIYRLFLLIRKSIVSLER